MRNAFFYLIFSMWCVAVIVFVLQYFCSRLSRGRAQKDRCTKRKCQKPCEWRYSALPIRWLLWIWQILFECLKRWCGFHLTHVSIVWYCCCFFRFRCIFNMTDMLICVNTIWVVSVYTVIDNANSWQSDHNSSTNNCICLRMSFTFVCEWIELEFSFFFFVFEEGKYSTFFTECTKSCGRMAKIS